MNSQLKNLNKNEKILQIVDFFQNKYGATNILISDHWKSDKEAIGLADRSGKFLAYISTISNKDNNYYLALENPSVYCLIPYTLYLLPLFNIPASAIQELSPRW